MRRPPTRTLRRSGMVVALAVAPVLAACGSDGTTSAAPEASVVRIDAAGSFTELDGRAVERLSGTGFVIDEAGLLVTNHHVVVGADRVDVRSAAGEEATDVALVASSECLDLAVIDLGAEGIASLDLEPSDLQPTAVAEGSPIVAVGFPEAADDAVTIAGSITAPSAPGATALTDIETTFEHSAVSTAGVSGSPVIGDGGSVVGMTFARTPEGDAMLAIPAETVVAAVEKVRAGDRPPTLELNVYALPERSSTTSGVFVRGVAPGSPAAAAGIRPGDILVRLGGVSLVDDITLATYCEVVRSTPPGTPLRVELIRPSSAVLLIGEIGGRPVGDALGAGPGG